MLPPPFLLSTDQRQKRPSTQDIKPFLYNIILQYTNLFSFETEPHHIHTIPLVREHCDSYLYYTRYKTLELLRSQNPFQIISNPIQGINTGTYFRTIHPQNIALSIQDVFITYMDKLIEHNENLETPVYLPSQLENLKEKHEYFDVPDLGTTISRHNNAHYWLQQDIAQFKQFQCRFFQHIVPNEDTVPQIKIFSHFLVKFFRFNYQLTWELQDQSAHIRFPQVLLETELLPFVIKNTNKHVHYKDPLAYNTTYFELIVYDTIFIIEHSETSDNRPYTNPNFSSEPSPDKHKPHILQHNTEQNISHTNQNETTE